MMLQVLLGFAPDFAASSLAVLLTYALHALVWCGAALVALSRAASAPSTQHRLWKLALLGPCASAPLASLGPWNVERVVAPRIVSLTDSSLPVGAVSSHAITTYAWLAWLALGAGVAAGLGLVRFAIALVRWRGRLRARTPVRDARVLRQLEQLCTRARCPRVLLTESAAIASPLVIGMRELCVPRAMLQELGDAELAAVLGHEVAHLERRDGVWFPIAGFLQSVLWMQPLNHWVAAHFRETAELACDDRAVELTGDRMGLARALVQVAESALRAEESGLVPTMASSRGGLCSRVKRLTDAARFPPRAARRPEWTSVIASLGVCAVASLVSSVRVAQSSHAQGPDARSQQTGAPSERLEALLRRDLELQRQLAQAERWSENHRGDRELAAWKSDLEQELRHVRAEATWTERRLESDARP